MRDYNKCKKLIIYVRFCTSNWDITNIPKDNNRWFKFDWSVYTEKESVTFKISKWCSNSFGHFRFENCLRKINETGHILKH